MKSRSAIRALCCFPFLVVCGIVEAEDPMLTDQGLAPTKTDGARITAASPTGTSDSSEVGLVAHWTFDEGSGHTAADDSGHGHEGVVNDAEWTAGKLGKALRFAGAAHVEVPDHEDLRIAQEVTLSAWVFRTEAHRGGGIVSKGEWDYDLFMSTSKPNHPALYSSAWGSGEVITQMPMTLNAWQHVAVTRAADGRSRIYLNGRLAGIAILKPDLQTSDDPLRIGHDLDASFRGTIDEVMLYNRVLSDAEIKSLANLSKASSPSNEPGNLGREHVDREFPAKK